MHCQLGIRDDMFKLNTSEQTRLADKNEYQEFAVDWQYFDIEENELKAFGCTRKNGQVMYIWAGATSTLLVWEEHVGTPISAGIEISENAVSEQSAFLHRTMMHLDLIPYLNEGASDRWASRIQKLPLQSVVREHEHYPWVGRFINFTRYRQSKTLNTWQTSLKRVFEPG